MFVLPRCLLGLLALLGTALFGQSTFSPDADKSLVYAANVGWINARPSAGDGAAFNLSYASGRLYAANVGWITLASGAPANGWRFLNATPSDWGVNLDAFDASGTASLRGFAYGANIGWIRFEDQGNPRIDLTSGRLRGYAWGVNVGWINLGDATGFPNSAVTLTLPGGPDTDGDGLPDAFEYRRAGDLATLSGLGGVDADGDGFSDLAEYFADTDPRDRADALRITSFGVNAAQTSAALAFTSTPSRRYTIERVTDLATGVWSAVPEANGIFGAAGLTNLSVAQTAGQARVFYRVVARPPLQP